MIKANKLTKKFDDLLVLYDINFEIAAGEIAAIIGPSGSGKTTLLRMMIGLEKEFAGEIFLCNTKQEEYLESNRIAFVSQKYSNFPWLTVEQNVELGLKKSPTSEDEDAVYRALEDVGLSAFKKYYIGQLSGGMQQRVAIARALCQDTPILAMDEPFGALDLHTRTTLQLLIKDINMKKEKTILFITHDMEEALFISDKVLPLTKLPSTILKTIECDYKEHMDINIKFTQEFSQKRRALELTLDQENLGWQQHF